MGQKTSAWLDHILPNMANPWLAGTLQAAVVIAIYLAFTILIKKCLPKFTIRFLKLSEGTIPSDIRLPLQKGVRRLLLIFAISLIADGFPLPDKTSTIVSQSLFILFVLVILNATFAFIEVFSIQFTKIGLQEFKFLFSKIARAFSVIIAALVVMRHFNYDVWQIVTALGIGSLAIGLAAQPTLTNMFAGFTLLLDRPFKPSDRISWSGGVEGDVLNIGMRSTRILTTDGNLLIVPNSELINSHLLNYCLPSRQITKILKMQFSWDADLPKIKASLLETINETANVDQANSSVSWSNVINSRAEITVTLRVEDFSMAGNAIDVFLQMALERLKSQGANLAPYPIVVS